MKKLFLIATTVFLLIANSFGQTQAGCAITFPNNFDDQVNFSDIYDPGLCATGNVVLWNLNDKNGLSTVTFDSDITLNNLTLNYKSGNNPLEIIILSGVTLTITNDLTMNLTSTVQDKYLTVEGDLIVGGTLDFGDISLEIDGTGTIDAGTITGAGSTSCATGDGGSGTCPTITADNCSDGTNNLCETTVPIVLGSFDVKGNKNEIVVLWSTTTEENNDYFTIERSADGKSFHELAVIPGAGNSSEPLEYTYTDNNPFEGVSYYRLKQTDYDGTSETFKVVAAEFYGKSEAIKVVQQISNPYQLKLFSNLDEENSATIYDVMGRSSITFTLKQGENTINLNTLSNDTGVYFIRVTNALGKELKSERILVQ